MKETAITVTEAARNFADCINRAYYQNMSFVLLKNGKPVARIVPAKPKVCLGKGLAAALAKTSLSDEEARAWYKDIVDARAKLQPPADKWQ